VQREEYIIEFDKAMDDFCSIPWDHWKKHKTCLRTLPCQHSSSQLKAHPSRCLTTASLGCVVMHTEQVSAVLCLCATLLQVWCTGGKTSHDKISTQIENMKWKHLETFTAFCLRNVMSVESNSKKIGLVKKFLSLCICIMWW